MLSVPVKPAPDDCLQVHATSVAFDGKAVVIAGPSGTGKSALGLRLISLGATLIADDCTWIRRGENNVQAACPPTLPAGLEVRGLGLLAAPTIKSAPIAAILDLGIDETERLPEPRDVSFFGFNIPLLHKPATPFVAEAILHYLTYGRL